MTVGVIAAVVELERDFDTTRQKIIGMRKKIGATHHMNSTDCECRVPNSPPTLAEQIDIGVTEDYWYISRMRCSSCGTPWLRAFMEHEAFSRSGRHYRAPVTDEVLIDVDPERALAILDEAAFKIAGGSYFNGVETVVRGPGKLISSP